jgi:two-component system cell cycle sensor histidine kinase/response regulator CckA
MPDRVLDEASTGTRFWGRLAGPTLTLGAVVVLGILDRTTYALPSPGVPLLLTVVIAGYAGGYGSGLLSAAIALVFAAATAASPATPFRVDLLGLQDQTQFAVLAVATPAMALLGGTARRRVDQATRARVRREREYSRGIFGSLPDGLLVSAPDGRITEVNARFIALTGFTREELIGRFPPFPFWHPAEERILTETLERALRGEPTEVDTVFRNRDGSQLPVILSRAPVRSSSGELSGVVSTIKDVAERRRASSALAESEERYRIITDTASDPIVTIDETSRILFANRAAERTFGHSREMMLGQSLTMLMPESYRARHLHGLQRYLATGERGIAWQGVELMGLHKTGSQIPLEVSFGEAVREGRRIFTGIIRDVSERASSQEALRRSELQLQQAQRMEAVGRLAGGIAHDFNNLLTAITGYTDLLLGDIEPGSPLRADLSEIRRTADRAAALTRQLLAFSRRQVLEAKVLDLNKVVGGLEPMLQRIIGEDVQLVTLLEPRLHRIKADPGQLEQVVMNLAVNSRDAMPGGGLLTIETANVFLDADYAEQHLDLEPGHYVMLAVSDTGVGMDAETRAHLFEPFFTTKDFGEGTGLGLATVYGIVTQSGGAIWVYSELGHGTTFKIYVPRESAPIEAAMVEVPSSGRLLGTETVLVVEDDPSVRALSVQVLRRLGYTALEAGSPSQAIALAEDHPGPIDAVLTDVVMPEMRGPELATRLVQIRPGMRVIYMSGYTGDAAVRHGLLDRGEAFLEKPFGPEALGRKMRELFDGVSDATAPSSTAPTSTFTTTTDAAPTPTDSARAATEAARTAS